MAKNERTGLPFVHSSDGLLSPFVRSPYNYDMSAAGDESGLRCVDESLTVQSEKDDADINVIVERFLKTGQVPGDFRAPQFGDFAVTHDFHSAVNAVRGAEANFMLLDARVRARFHNNPQELLEFVSDSENRDEAVKLGLVPAPEAPAPEPAPQRVIVVDPKAPPGGAV